MTHWLFFLSSYFHRQRQCASGLELSVAGLYNKVKVKQKKKEEEEICKANKINCVIFKFLGENLFTPFTWKIDCPSQFKLSNEKDIFWWCSGQGRGPIYRGCSPRAVVSSTAGSSTPCRVSSLFSLSPSCLSPL